jgi:CHAT domain-containing protein
MQELVKNGLLAILLFTSGIKVQTAPLEARQTVSGADTVALENQLFRGDREGAALSLGNFLKANPQAEPATLSNYWLLLAMVDEWNQEKAQASEAYSHYEENRENIGESRYLRSNRLLYKALGLSAEGKNNQAADSLIASIAIRPTDSRFNKILLADSYSELAAFYSLTGDLFEASRNFDRSVSLNRDLGRSFMLAVNLTAYSPVLSMIDAGDPKADSVLVESLEIFSRLDSLSYKAQVLNELGVLYNRRGNIRKSLNYFIQSLNVKSRIRRLPRQDFIVVTNNIGACYAYLGIPDSAKYYFARAIDFARESGSNPAAYLVNLGTYYGLREEYDEALALFQKALNALDPNCSPTDLEANPDIGMASPQLAEFTAYKAHTFHRRYDISHHTSDLIDGLNTFMSALGMIDTLRFMYSFESKPYLSSEAKFHYFNALDMALDLYQVTGDKKYLDQAFQLSERNKSATLNEFLRTNQAREFMDNIAPWIRKEDSIKLEINTLKTKLAKYSGQAVPSADSTDFLRNRVSMLTDELRQLESRARKENPDYFRMIYSNGSYTPGDLQKLLEPREAFLDYTVVHDDRLNKDYMVIMALTRDTLFTCRDTLPPDFSDAIRDFRSSITSLVDIKVFREFVRTARQLDQYFFEPVEKFHDIDKLIILPDEEIGFLPFEVFLTDTATARETDFRKLSYLNRRYAISYVSSHEQFHQFRTRPRETAQPTVYAFAPFADQGARLDTLDLPALGSSKKETETISKIYRTRVYLDAKAGKKELLHAFNQPSVVSLSTHGIMDLVHPMQSRLLMNPSQPDASLYLFELLSLRIRSPLVILNACNTGSGKLQVGEGIMSMSRGFQFAGVRSIITTLWPIDDQSSATLMKFFFQNLRQGMDERDALRNARISYIDQADRLTGAPFFWAGQILIGDPGSIRIRHRPGPWLPLAGLAVTLILLGFGYFRKKRA